MANPDVLVVAVLGSGGVAGVAGYWLTARSQNRTTTIEGFDKLVQALQRQNELLEQRAKELETSTANATKELESVMDELHACEGRSSRMESDLALTTKHVDELQGTVNSLIARLRTEGRTS